MVPATDPTELTRQTMLRTCRDTHLGFHFVMLVCLMCICTGSSITSGYKLTSTLTCCSLPCAIFDVSRATLIILQPKPSCPPSFPFCALRSIAASQDDRYFRRKLFNQASSMCQAYAEGPRRIFRRGRSKKLRSQ